MTDDLRLPAGPVKVILTGNGANLDVRRTIAALNETDLFIDAREPLPPLPRWSLRRRRWQRSSL